MPLKKSKDPFELMGQSGIDDDVFGFKGEIDDQSGNEDIFGLNKENKKGKKKTTDSIDSIYGSFDV